MAERLGTPSFDLKKIQEVTREGRLVWLPKVSFELPTKAGGRARPEIERIILGLTVERNFFCSEETEYGHHKGQLFDQYVWQFSPEEGLLMKFAPEPEGCFRIFSCHHTDIRTFYKERKKRGIND